MTISCGLHKTGSSAIQVALKHQLRAERVMVPVSGQPFDLSDVRQKIRSLPNDGVYADEHLFGTALDGYASLPKYVQQLNSALDERPARIIFCVRPHVRWLESLYVQLIMMGENVTAREFIDGIELSPWVNWADMYDFIRLATSSSDVLMLPYNPAHDMTIEFLDLLEVPYSRRKVRRMGRVNRSLPPARAKLLQIAMSSGVLTKSEVVASRAALQSLPSRTMAEWSSILPESIQQLIIDKHKKQWAILSTCRNLDSRCRAAFEAIDSEAAYAIKPYVGDTLQSPELGDEADFLFGEGARVFASHKRMRSPVPRLLKAVRQIFEGG